MSFKRTVSGTAANALRPEIGAATSNTNQEETQWLIANFSEPEVVVAEALAFDTTGNKFPPRSQYGEPIKVFTQKKWFNETMKQAAILVAKDWGYDGLVATDAQTKLDAWIAHAAMRIVVYDHGLSKSSLPIFKSFKSWIKMHEKAKSGKKNLDGILRNKKMGTKEVH